MIFNKSSRLHKIDNKDDDYSIQFKEIEEFIFRQCEAEKIEWRRLKMEDRLKLAARWGCLREYQDSIRRRKFC